MKCERVCIPLSLKGSWIMVGNISALFCSVCWINYGCLIYTIGWGISDRGEQGEIAPSSKVITLISTHHVKIDKEILNSGRGREIRMRT